MNIHSPSEHVKTASSFLLAITAASTNGSNVDTQGYTRAKVVFDSQPTGSGTTSTCQVQSAPDSGGSPGSWVNVGTNLVATFGATVGVQVEDIQLNGPNILGNRWLRLVHTGAGGSAGGVAAGHIELYNPAQFPVAQANTVGAVI